MKKMFKLVGLDCAHCAGKIEENIAKLDGVKNVTVNFMTTKLSLETDDNMMDIVVENAKKIISSIEPDVEVVKA